MQIVEAEQVFKLTEKQAYTKLVLSKKTASRFMRNVTALLKPSDSVSVHCSRSPKFGSGALRKRVKI